MNEIEHIDIDADLFYSLGSQEDIKNYLIGKYGNENVEKIYNILADEENNIY